VQVYTLSVNGRGIDHLILLTANFLHASSLYKPYNYGNNCNNKQNMNDASRVKCEKPNQPSNNKNDG